MIRRILFWLHLAAGVSAGVVIALMSFTGVVLTYERQINEWTLAHLRSVPPTTGATPASLEEVLSQVAQAQPGVVTGITRASRPDGPVIVTTGSGALYLDAYTGQSLGDRRGEGVRAFLAGTRALHRWLAIDGDARPVARAITGWSNLLFAFVVLSGMYLWLPRVWSAASVRAVALFRTNYGTSKARDFNWHHVIGIWTAIPLFIVVLSAVPISFPWAGDLVYQMVGETPPSRGQAGPPGRAETRPAGPAQVPSGRSDRAGSGTAATVPSTDGLDRLFTLAAAEHADWRTITVRLPRRAADPVAFTIDRGDGGQPHLRSTVTFDATGAVVARETFASQSLGRRVRSVMRFAHTGEVAGLIGQTVAGLVSAGAVVMVWTGLALSWRRFLAWRQRHRRATSPAPIGRRDQAPPPASVPSPESLA